MSGLAFNLANVAYYEPGRQFIDWMKFADAWRSDNSNSMSGVTTDAAGYSAGAVSITLAAGGVGSLPTGKVIYFGNGHIYKYLVTSGLADVASGGTITIEKMATDGEGLSEAIPATATSVNQHGYGAYDYAALKFYGYLNENGYPNAIPPQMNHVGTIWSIGSGVSDPDVAGNYVATWEGAATVVVQGDRTITLDEEGRIEFTHSGANPVYLSITGGLSEGDPLTSIKMFRGDYETLLEDGEIFNPEWLPTVDGSRGLRFMDWMLTNWSTQSEWADRPQVDDVTYMLRGVPVEIMVALANKVGADPWFCMPHLATDEYIENFAIYVRDHLNEALRANVEYSNETWNSGFGDRLGENKYGQFTWLYLQAQSAWGDGNLWLQYEAKKATETALIWNAVYGYTGKGNPRLYHILGVQLGYKALAETQVAAEAWNDNEPENFVDPKTVLDSLGITCYQGGEHVANLTHRAALLAEIDANPGNVEAVYDWLTDRNLNSTSVDWTVPYITNIMSDWRIYADIVGMDLSAYEGGTHEWHSFLMSFAPGELAKLRDFFFGYLYSTQYAAVMNATRVAWETYGNGPFMHLTDIARPSDSGCWGAKRYLSDSSPRWYGLTQIKYGLPFRPGYVGVRAKAA